MGLFYVGMRQDVGVGQTGDMGYGIVLKRTRWNESTEERPDVGEREKYAFVAPRQ